MADPRFHVIFLVDTGAGRNYLIEREGVDPVLIDTMISQGLLRQESDGFVKVTKGGWSFWEAYMKRKEAEDASA